MCDAYSEAFHDVLGQLLQILNEIRADLYTGSDGPRRCFSLGQLLGLATLIGGVDRWWVAHSTMKA